MKNLQPLSNRLDPARGSSLAQIKTHQLAREEDDKMKKRRLKGIIVLVEQFLLEQGYIQSLKSLQQESNISLDQVCVADNMDLPTIVTEYEEFYEFKFARKPKLFRTRGADDGGVSVVTEGGEKMLQRRHKPPPSTAPSSSGSPSYARPDGPNTPPGESGAKGSEPPPHLRAIAHRGKSEPGQRPLSPLRLPNGRSKGGGGGGGGLSLEGQSISPSTQRIGVPDASNRAPEDDHFFGRGLKPMPTFATSEMNDLAATIMRDILDVNPSVRWTDIAELENAKLLLREAVVMPVRYPELFQGLLRPWKGILLFGPPGTGKTLLAKAVATECNTTFFNISASSVVSKWRGDSEKLVRMLFDLALHYAPSTIFIDEIDSLMSSRSMEGEHEGSRRMKTELLTQMDGLSKRQGGDVVFVLAASNVPWDLDTAMLRRLEKRILVDLPKESARAAMFYMLLKHTTPSPSGGGELDWGACARMTEGLSGADIDIVCREAVMRHVRKLIEELENHGEKREKLSNTRTDRLVVTLEDIEASIACTKSSVRGADLKRFVQWAKEFGSGMSV